MTLHPGVIALLAGAAAVAGLLLYSAWHAVAVLRHWDLESGSARQLSLERRTYLISTIVAYVLAFELASLFLLVYTADALAPLFTGAMCAAGTLAANRFGYPTLLLGLANFVLAGLWLVVNHADNRGRDYPLIRTKYALLLALTPLVLLEGVLRARYFLGLEPEVITSCCGSLFSRGSGRGGAAAALATLPGRPAAVVLFGTIAAAGGAGAAFRRLGRGGLAVLLAVLAAVALPLGLAVIVAWVSPYVYELPTHRCPFCLLQAEYGWVGYPLYGTLLAGAVCGMGAGVLAPFRRVPSLAAAVPGTQRRLALAAILLFACFAALVAWRVLASHLAT